jgi:hypothetical protein
MFLLPVAVLRAAVAEIGLTQQNIKIGVVNQLHGLEK